MAWAQIAPPPGWTDDPTAALTALIAAQEWPPWILAEMSDRLVHAPGAAGSGGNTLVNAAAAAGHGELVRNALDSNWPEPARSDHELMLWAADYGAYEVVLNRLAPETTRPMLEIARGWLAGDPAVELRRRLGGGEAAEERRTVPIGDGYAHVGCLRVTAADGRWAEVMTGHLAIVTYIEEALGIGPSLDELLARSLSIGDPDDLNWWGPLHAVKGRADVPATLRWAVGVLESPDPGARDFASVVVHLLSLEEQPAPERETVLPVLRRRLAAEREPQIRLSLLAALDSYEVS